ncbi:hypothetical protein VTN00DRAFT_5082 [Thermoascus crustaceus]|uniref:uncharacterized protein n=1 Tax=Thermoascus crustaceus TaxID=5088 RepID=UPI003744AA62
MWNHIATVRQALLASSGVTRAIYATARLTTPSIAGGHSTTTTTTTTTMRTLSTTASLFTRGEQKTMDRSTLRPERTEYSKSGTDDEVAGHPSAYDPSNTSPEGQTEASGRESQQEGKISNPLDVSPANKDVSQARDPMEGAPDQNVKSGRSVRGSPRKREVNVGQRR